ncbi:MAG: ATP-dependent helicase [Pedosphaera sp.]|nr:ATP-dependent helicase [Pedosphaera sp.]
MSRDYVLQPFQPPAELRIDYQRELNAQQFAAVSAPVGPALVLAGAGAGKTRTLIYRVAWLLEHGVPADRILLLTFTNKAAREMMQRVGELLGGDLSGLLGGTFHSVGMRILRRHADRLGYRADFTIADREDSKDLLSACIVDAGIEVKESRFPKPEALSDILSLAANKQRTVPEMLASNYPSFLPIEEQIVDVANRYRERKRTTGAMDFDDLIGLWVRLLREHPDIREMYQRRFQHVLVDEYQDTNQLQSDLIDLVAGAHHNVMAVGDDSQSIYSWRGANFANILEFPKRHPTARVYKIETNYRSTPEIVSLANAVIAANTRQFSKELKAARKSGAKPVLAVCGEASEQAVFVAQRALELRDEGVNLNRMAVLYRSHFHALELQLELTRRNIPFSITSGIRFFEQAHIKDVAAYLKFVINPADELAFKRLVKMLPGIGGRGADKLWNEFRNLCPPPPPPSPLAAAASMTEPSDNEGLLETPSAAPPFRDPVAPLLVRVAPRVPKKASVGWAQFTATISQCEGPDTCNDPAALIRLVVEAEISAYVEATYENSRNRLEDLDQLASYARQFNSTVEFLTQLALLSNAETETNANTQEEERLKLSTVHQAKGLEFDVVFVIMLCEGMFPSGRALDSIEGEEEERRLFYVAVTRARSELYLSYPLLRFAGGGGNAMQQGSRFLGELPKNLLEEWNLHPAWGTASSSGFDSATNPESPQSADAADEPF